MVGLMCVSDDSYKTTMQYWHDPTYSSHLYRLFTQKTLQYSLTNRLHVWSQHSLPWTTRILYASGRQPSVGHKSLKTLGWCWATVKRKDSYYYGVNTSDVISWPYYQVLVMLWPAWCKEVELGFSLPGANMPFTAQALYLNSLTKRQSGLWHPASGHMARQATPAMPPLVPLIHRIF